MKQLPLLTVLGLVLAVLAWNVSFYSDFYRARAGAGPRGDARESVLRPVRPEGVERAAAAPTELEEPDEVSGARMPEPGDEVSEGVSEGEAPVPDRHGEVRIDYPDGARKTRGTLVDGRRHGPWTEFHPNGQLLKVGHFEHGQKVGEWRYYHEDGLLGQRIEFVDGLRHGETETWFPTGRVKSEGHYERDEREGRWTLYYPDGGVKERGEYERGRREGLWEFYDSEGNLNPRRSGRYENGELVDR